MKCDTRGLQLQAFNQIIDFDNGQADNPDTPSEGSRYTIGNVLKNPKLVSIITRSAFPPCSEILTVM